MLQPFTDVIRRHRRTQRKIMSSQDAPPTEPAPSFEEETNPQASVEPLRPPPPDLTPGQKHGDPGARSPSERVKDLAVQELLTMHETVKGYMAELLDPTGAFAKSRVAMIADLSLVVERGIERVAKAFEPRITGIEAKLSKQGDNILALEMELKKHKEASDAKFAELEAQIAQVKESRGPGEAAGAPTG
jgi:hypothetical protein